MDFVTQMNMRARNACYRETFVNYEEAVDKPLDRTGSPGDIDAWFYSQVPISRSGSANDELKNYDKRDKKRISKGALVMAYSPFANMSDAETSTITETMPEQVCAKRCTLNNCSGFTYDKNYSKGTCYIYRGDVKMNDCDSCNTYIRRVPEPVPERKPAPAPAPAPTPQPLVEVTVYQGENFSRGNTTYKFFEADFKKGLFGMTAAIVNWPNKQEVNSFVFTANTSSTWFLSFPSRDKAFPMPNFSGKKSNGTLEGAGGYHGSMIVFRK